MKTLISAIKELGNGSQVNSYFCVQERNPPKAYAKGFMFNVTLCDKSGEIDLTYWGGGDETAVHAVYDSFKEDDVIFVAGKVGDFRGKKIDVNMGVGEIRPAVPTEYTLEDFIVQSNQNINDLWNELLETKASFDNLHLKNLLDAFFTDADFVNNFKRAPAAMKIHHACCGGLLEHTWEVLRYCKTAADVHPSLDKSLLFAGAMLHDIGKIQAFNVSMSIKESKKGMLTDHIFIATELILDKISKQPDFPDLLKEKLIHMILSHHGKKEYGVTVEPKLPEASALSCADLMGSQITQYIRAKRDAATSTDFKSGWNKHIGPVFLE
jgi:3'-5' exoribonuclease